MEQYQVQDWTQHLQETGGKITGDYAGRDRPGTGVYYKESVYNPASSQT